MRPTTTYANQPTLWCCPVHTHACTHFGEPPVPVRSQWHLIIEKEKGTHSYRTSFVLTVLLIVIVLVLLLLIDVLDLYNLYFLYFYKLELELELFLHTVLYSTVREIREDVGLYEMTAHNI